jgi:hypothetical protein
MGGKIGVAEHEVVGVAHGPQRVKNIGIQERVDRFQHATPPGTRISFLD